MKVLPNFSSHLKDCVVNKEPSLFLMRFNLDMEGVENSFLFSIMVFILTSLAWLKAWGTGFLLEASSFQIK